MVTSVTLGGEGAAHKTVLGQLPEWPQWPLPQEGLQGISLLG